MGASGRARRGAELLTLFGFKVLENSRLANLAAFLME
jgi:hypothetical protein